MDYIDRIKKLKSEQKITNDRLSDMTGIPLGTLSKILAGISDSPNWRTWWRLRRRWGRPWTIWSAVFRKISIIIR